MIEAWEGRQVERCRVEEYEHKPGDARLPIALELVLGGKPHSIECAVSGDLRVEERSLVPVDMQSDGRTVVRDRGWPCGVLSEFTLANVQPLVDLEGNRFGAMLRTSQGERVYVVNWGDDLLLESELPAAVRRELAA